MSQLRFYSATLTASAVFLLSSLASAVVARPIGCGAGPACAYGFECAEVGASSCAPSAPCPAGQECPAVDPCVTTVEYGCVPSHCADDAQCAPGMVCHAWTEPCASSGCACASDTPNCDCGAPTVCDPQTVSVCTPKYDLPCQVAADCGTGFTCEEAQSCGCSAGGSATPPMMGSGGSSSAGAAPAPAAGGPASDPLPIDPPDCSCQPSGQMQCVPMQVMCATDAQCPAGWSCQAEAVTNTAAPACAPGMNCPTPPAPAPSGSWCVPPYYGASSGGDLQVPSTPTTGTGTSGPGTPTKGGPGTAGTTSTGTPNEGTPTPGSTGEAESHESSACAMGHAPASSGALALLAMLGALFGLKRRRAVHRM
jgi:hypothetical protein